MSTTARTIVSDRWGAGRFAGEGNNKGRGHGRCKGGGKGITCMYNCHERQPLRRKVSQGSACVAMLLRSRAIMTCALRKSVVPRCQPPQAKRRGRRMRTYQVPFRAPRRRRRHTTRLGSNPRLPLDEVNAENAMLKATPSANVYHCAGKLWALEKASALILQICIDKAIPTQGVMVMPNSMYVQLPRVSTTAQAGF